MRPTRLLAAAATALALATAHARAPTPAALDRALAGRWQGELAYRDYQSGRGVETLNELARVLEHTSATHWTAEWQRQGVDGNQPSDIRTTVTRRGDELRAVKEVREQRPAGAAEAAWVFRNETLLRRQP